MNFDILTIFPGIIDSYKSESILKRAENNNLIKITAYNIRDEAIDKRSTVDDRPFGGGPGMVMMVEPIYKTLKNIKKQKKTKVVMLDPGGRQFSQIVAREYSELDQLILICGRYEGIDARVDEFIDEKVSIGPYVLSGGEMPALIITEAVARLLPGVLGNEDAIKEETDALEGYVEYPQYTRPETFTYRKGLLKKKLTVPEVLLSGDHKKIEEWHKNHSK